MDVQIALGADIAMAFDECTEYPADRERAPESLRLTHALGAALARIISARTAKKFRGAANGRIARKPRRRASLALCRAACTPICAGNARSGWWRWISTATPLAA